MKLSFTVLSLLFGINAHAATLECTLGSYDLKALIDPQSCGNNYTIGSNKAAIYYRSAQIGQASLNCTDVHMSSQVKSFGKDIGSVATSIPYFEIVFESEYGEEYIRLTNDVRISFTDNNSHLQIKLADGNDMKANFNFFEHCNAPEFLVEMGFIPAQ